MPRWLAVAFALALLLAASPALAGAQQSDSTVRVTVRVGKAGAIERTLKAFTEAGLTATGVSGAGLVTARGDETNVTVTYRAAITGDSAQSDVALSAIATYVPFANTINPIEARVTSRMRGGDKVWARLIALGKQIQEGS